MMKLKRWMAVVALGVGAIGLAHANATQPSPRALTRAVTQYLSEHGDLCVGKFTWPRVVTPEDRLAGTNDAVQLPVLERLGLVESTEISAPAAATPATATPAPTAPPAAQTAGTATRYALTAKGRQYYLQKRRITLGVHDQPVEHDEDLCLAHLTLDRVVKWSPPEPAHGHLETMVHYTYHIKSAEWMADTEARRVFPVVDRIVRGQGNLLMSVNVQLRDGKWQPVLPGQ
jgi:hypothetical protein